MNLFVLSHPCVTPTNQEFFAEVERQSGWSLTITAPAQWKGEYGVRERERWPRFEGTLLSIPVVGEGSYAPVLADRLAASGLQDRLIEVGYVPHPDAPHYPSTFDVLVLPSETQANWREQFGRVIIEAMACGTPVVGSSSGEIPNLLHKTGGGRVFEEGNPADRFLQTIQAASRSHLAPA